MRMLLSFPEPSFCTKFIIISATLNIHTAILPLQKIGDFISLQMHQLVFKRWPFTSSKGIHNEGCSLWKSLLLMIAWGLLTVRESPEMSGVIFFTCVITLALSPLLFWKVKREVICYKERINPAVWLPLGCVTVLITGAEDIMDKLTVSTSVCLSIYCCKV